jgi:REP element-mobilizing transposase RayT
MSETLSKPIPFKMGLQVPRSIRAQTTAESHLRANSQTIGPIFHALARQKECQIIEGHLMPDHVHMCIAIPPKHPVASVIGFLKGKSAIAIARSAARNETSRASTSGPAVTLYRPSGSNWSRSAPTSASRTPRMEQADNSEVNQ